MHMQARMMQKQRQPQPQAAQQAPPPMPQPQSRTQAPQDGAALETCAQATCTVCSSTGVPGMRPCTCARSQAGASLSPLLGAGAPARRHARAKPKKAPKPMCEECTHKPALYGHPDTPLRDQAVPDGGRPRSSAGQRRWCGVCKRDKPGAIEIDKPICEDCFVRTAKLKLPGDMFKKWCAKCAKARPGAVSVSYDKICEGEGCEKRKPTWALSSQRKGRWCGSCAKTLGEPVVRQWLSQHPPQHSHAHPHTRALRARCRADAAREARVRIGSRPGCCAC